MRAAPVQKTALIPRGLCAAQDDSAFGTLGVGAISRLYRTLHARAICPVASVTISGFSLTIATRKPLARPTSAPRPMLARMPSANRLSEFALTPTRTFPQREITPAVERSMPACMITSIWPSAAIARIVMYGSTNAHDVLRSAAGRDDAATTRSSATVAIQIGQEACADERVGDARRQTGVRDGARRPRCHCRVVHGASEDLAPTRRPFSGTPGTGVNHHRTKPAISGRASINA